MTNQPDQVAADDCYRCGYDLRGIANDQACPECGLLAERSRRVSDELHDTRPRWLKRLARGVWLMLLSLLCPALWPLVFEPLARWLWKMGVFSPSGRTDELLPFICLAYSAGIFLLGAVMLTSPERYGPADFADRRRRWLLRGIAAVPLLGAVAAAGLIDVAGTRFVHYSNLHGCLYIISMTVLAAVIPLPVLLFSQLRSLARRARSAHLAEHCTVVGIGASAGALYTGLMITLFEFAQSLGMNPNWQARSPIALILMLICSLFASLFALWSIYLLLRFAMAFHTAARKLNRKWKRDDRAAAN